MRIRFLSLIFLFSLCLESQTLKDNVGVADSLFQLGNYKGAINAYAKENSPQAQLQIARAYHATGNSQKAIVQYENILKNNPENALAKFELGKLLDKTKKYGRAALLFEELTNKHQDNAEFHYYLGKVLQSNLEYEKGNTALQKAIDLDSTHLKSIYLLGKHYVGAQDPSDAIPVIEIGLKTAPNDVALINLKALAHFDLGNYERAAPLFERLIELGEKKPFVFKKLGYSYANRWKYKEAKEAYRKLGRMENQEADAYLGLGQVFLLEKALDSAEIYFQKSIEERRYIFDDEYRNLGRIARLKGALKKALDYYTKAWEENKANQFNYWQVCVLADEYYKEPKVKLGYYERLLDSYKNLAPFLNERAQKRIKELKTEIHFKGD